jgi:hypothetical protein
MATTSARMPVGPFIDAHEKMSFKLRHDLRSAPRAFRSRFTWGLIIVVRRSNRRAGPVGRIGSAGGPGIGKAYPAVSRPYSPMGTGIAMVCGPRIGRFGCRCGLRPGRSVTAISKRYVCTPEDSA